MDLTSRVLERLRGRLDTIVSHPGYAGPLIVRGRRWGKSREPTGATQRPKS
jgi:hypothetical protein